jgi:putative transposase
MSVMDRFPVPGQTQFFTLRTAQAGGSLLVERITALRAAWAAMVAEQPTICLAMVVLPDHLHAVLRLPPGSKAAAIRWARFRSGFAQAVAPEAPERVWQPDILVQPLRDAGEVNRALAACWDAPVRLGLARSPEDWPYCSLHRDLRQAARRRVPAQGLAVSLRPG